MNESLLVIIPGILVTVCVVVICWTLYDEKRQALDKSKPDTMVYWNHTDDDLINITRDHPIGSLIRELGDRFDLAKRDIDNDFS